MSEGISYGAFSVRASGWPAWAVITGHEAANCPPPGGLDAETDMWAVTCASDPLLQVGPSDVAAIRYRAPEPVDASGLSVAWQFLGAGLVELPATVTLEPR